MPGGTAILFLVALTIASGAAPARAHELRPGYLELRQSDAETYQVLWKVPAKGDLRLSLEARLPPECSAGAKSVRSTAEARVERWSARCPGGVEGKRIHVEGLSATMTDVLVRLEGKNGSSQVTRLTPLSPSFVAASAPGPLDVAKTYLVLGAEHILLGFDHLLFVLALMILVKGGRRLIGTVTAFTFAHSLTLAAASLGWVHIPLPPVEAVIALSIVFVAVEIVHARQGRWSLTERRPWIVAFVFGLLHGLGFAGALSEVGLPAGEIPLALLMFNLGVELGQLLFIGLLYLPVSLLRRRIHLPRWTDWAPPYAIGGMAMFWLLQRLAAF